MKSKEPVCIIYNFKQDIYMVMTYDGKCVYANDSMERCVTFCKRNWLKIDN